MEYLLKFLKDYKDEIQSITALVAIAFTAITLWIQRRHNFKSVTPIAHFGVGNYENEISVRLGNKGVGPLIVKEFEVSNGSRQENDLISFMPKQPQGIFWKTYYQNFSDSCISPNQEIIILQLVGNLTDENFISFRDDVRRSLSKLSITVTFTDIYNRDMPKKIKSLDWFDRRSRVKKKVA